MINRNHALRLIPVCAAALLLAACATAPTHNNAAASAESSHAVLKQRASERWQLLIARKGDQAWNYLTPGYRATTTQKRYADEMDHRPVKWTGANVTKVDCASADKCEVYVMVLYDINLPGIASGGKSFSPQKEIWLRLGNQWYYLPREEGKSTIHATH